jgi:hypothetical protein
MLRERLIAPITASLVGEENAIKKLEKTVSEIGLEEAIKAIAPLKRIVVKGKKLELWLDKPRCNPVIIKRSGSLVIELI